MKKIYCIFSLFFLFFSQIHAEVPSPCKPKVYSESFSGCGKVYVKPDQLAMSGKRIFVKFGDEWFLTEALFSDDRGIFILNLTSSAYGCPDPYNACRNCMRCIHENYNICPYCKLPA